MCTTFARTMGYTIARTMAALFAQRFFFSLNIVYIYVYVYSVLARLDLSGRFVWGKVGFCCISNQNCNTLNDICGVICVGYLSFFYRLAYSACVHRSPKWIKLRSSQVKLLYVTRYHCYHASVTLSTGRLVRCAMLKGALMSEFASRMLCIFFSFCIISSISLSHRGTFIILAALFTSWQITK